eukprot:10823997-Alexandrium_andersonii.AAC.1
MAWLRCRQTKPAPSSSQKQVPLMSSVRLIGPSVLVAARLRGYISRRSRAGHRRALVFGLGKASMQMRSNGVCPPKLGCAWRV